MSGALIQEYKKFYEDKAYIQALELLEQNRDEFDSGVYEYNLSINYYHLEKYVDARYYMEKAIREGMHTQKSQKILDGIKSKLEIGELEAKEQISDYFYDYSTHFSLYQGLGASLILMIIYFSLLRKISGLSSKSILLLGTLIPFAFSVFIKFSYAPAVLKQEVKVREGASLIFDEKTVLPAGMKVIATPKKSPWIYIYSPSAFRGWVLSEEVRYL